MAGAFEALTNKVSLVTSRNEYADQMTKCRIHKQDHRIFKYTNNVSDQQQSCDTWTHGNLFHNIMHTTV